MTRFWVVLAGSWGLAAAAYTARFYAGVDGLALAVTGLIAAGLLLGVIELVWYTGTLERLRHELGGVSRAGTREGIDGASPVLRALLRARLDRVALPVPGPTFAPFLVGLLVMLGLLGTFLGLFETLRGAHGALSSSGDMESLRAGLSTPMAGLMRSFGTSAAGVTASACLGLALVFFRRGAARFGLDLHAAATGPLAAESASYRQLDALERLATLASAWPTAAERLDRTADAMAGLADAWTRAHAEAADRVAASQRDALERVTKEQHQLLQALSAGQLETLGALTARQEDTLRGLAAGQRGALEALTSAQTLSLGELRDTQTRALGTLATAQASSMTELRDAQGRALEALAGAQTGSMSELRGAQSEALTALTRGQERVFERILEAQARGGEVAAQAQADAAQVTAEAVRSTARELQLALGSGVDRATTSLRDGLGGAFDALVERLGGELSSQLGALAAQSSAQSAELSAEWARVTEGAQQSLAQLGPLAEGALRQSVASAEEHLTGVREVLTRDAAARVEADAALRAAFEAHVAALGERLETERAQERASVAALAREVQSALADIGARERARAEAAEGTERARAESLASAEKARAETLASAEKARAETLASAEKARAESLAGLAERVGRELSAASDALRARVDTRAEAEVREAARMEALYARLDEAGRSIAQAADRQASALDAMVASGEARLQEAQDAQDTRLTELLDRVGAAQEAQEHRLAAFEGQIAGLHYKGALTLADELRAHAEGLSRGLADSGALIAEAAGLVHSGGAEMTAVAEGFAKAVESQREAARAWLESLGQVEAAVARAGESVAADLLGDHLAQTHEVFDRQLRFQSELFEQLRALRPPTAGEA